MNLDAIESLICSRALMISQTSVVNMDAESVNLMKITVFDEKLYHKSHNFHPVNHLYKQECDLPFIAMKSC